jgi:PTH1 family peptidyl-tRNA hydrolase
MKLIVGLGNPEERYRETRHNTGFKVVDHFAAAKGASFQRKDKFKADIAEISSNDEKVIVAKPTTYYNLSGEAARTIADFYKIDPRDVLVVHDELVLPFGTIRTRYGGSDAGNNGVKSLNEHLGPDTARLRFGIYNDLRDKIDDVDFVLSKFSVSEAERFPELYKKTAAIIDDFVAGNFDTTTHR